MSRENFLYIAPNYMSIRSCAAPYSEAEQFLIFLGGHSKNELSFVLVFIVMWEIVGTLGRTQGMYSKNFPKIRYESHLAIPKFLEILKFVFIQILFYEKYSRDSWERILS